MAKPKSVRKGRKAASPLPDEMHMPEDIHARSKLALDINDDLLSDDDSLDEDEVLGLSEDSEEDSELDSSDEDTKYGQREFSMACMRAPRPCSCSKPHLGGLEPPQLSTARWHGPAASGQTPPTVTDCSLPPCSF
jgi:hypothetical protein